MIIMMTKLVCSTTAHTQKQIQDVQLPEPLIVDWVVRKVGEVS